MRPNLIDTLARAALSRAGRMPPSRDALAHRPGAGTVARPRPAIRGVAADATPPAEATVFAMREPATPFKGSDLRQSLRAPSRSASARTPPTLDLRTYLERRRGKP